MITKLVNALVVLAQGGVTVFVASHNYFIQQEIQLEANYLKDGTIPTRFISLYEENDMICAETKEFAYQLEHNAIMDEFDYVYNREQELMGE